MALEYEKSVKLTLQNLLAPFDALINQAGRSEERATTVRIGEKRLKVKSNNDNLLLNDMARYGLIYLKTYSQNAICSFSLSI